MKEFERWRGSSAGAQGSTEATVVLDEFMQFAAPLRPVLDLGCGRGVYGRSVGYEGYVGIDPIALPHLPFPFVRGVAERLPFRDATFETVVALGSIDHFASVDHALKEVVRVLRPGGRFLLLQHVVRSGTRYKIERFLAYLRAGDLRGLSRSVLSNVRFLSRAEAEDGYGHLVDFSERGLRRSLSSLFRIEGTGFHKQQMFISARARAQARDRKLRGSPREADSRGVRTN